MTYITKYIHAHNTVNKENNITVHELRTAMVTVCFPGPISGFLVCPFGVSLAGRLALSMRMVSSIAKSWCLGEGLSAFFCLLPTRLDIFSAVFVFTTKYDRWNAHCCYDYCNYEIRTRLQIYSKF